MKIGLDVGSTTIKCVVLDETDKIVYSTYERHFSHILEKSEELLRRVAAQFAAQTQVELAISGSAGMGMAESCGIDFIQEVYATKVAISHRLPDTDVVIELGGEDAKILFLPFDRLLAAAAAIVLHEGSHLLAMAFCGVKRISIEWTPLGFVAQAGSLPLLPVGKRFCIAAAGLGASAAGAAVCLPFAMQHRFAYELLNANLSIGLLNSLPVLPLDGSRILLAAAAKLGVEKGMAKLLLAVSYATSGGVCALGLYSACCGMLRPALCVLGPYLAYAAWRSARES